MKVKIGDKIVDANDEPIMLIFDSQDEKETVIKHLFAMTDEARKYCMYPEGSDSDDIREFMKV